MKTIAYIRVSTAKQVERGLSLEAQREKVQAYASLYDLEICEVIVDAGVSAKTLARPGLQRALGMLRDGSAEALLVVKLDRLTRSVRDLDTLIQDYFATGRWALLSVGEQIDTRSAAGRLVLNVLASVSQWEREATSERTSVALRSKSASGGYVGGDAPYGFTVTAGGLVAIEAEQAVIARARELRGLQMSLRKVSGALESEGKLSRTGRPFLPAQLSRMLGEAARAFDDGDRQAIAA